MQELVFELGQYKHKGEEHRWAGGRGGCIEKEILWKRWKKRMGEKRIKKTKKGSKV